MANDRLVPEPTSTPAEIAKELRAAAQVAEGECAAALQRIESILLEYDTFDLLSWVAFEHLNIDPDNYSEPAHRGSIAKVEFLTLQALRVGYSTSDAGLPEPATYRVLSESIDTVFQADWIIDLSAASARTSPDDWEGLARSTRLHEQFVRGPGYPVHQARVINALFDPFRDFMRSELGFDVEDALHLQEALSILVSSKMHAKKVSYRSQAIELERNIRKFRAGKREAPREIVSHVEQWVSIPDAELSGAIRRFGAAYLMNHLGVQFSTTPHELSQTSKLPETTCEAFLKAFSSSFGDIDERYRKLQPVHPLKSRPLVHHEGRYLLHLSGGLIWSVQPVIEEHIKASKLTEKYSKHKHDTIASIAAECFLRVMHGAEAIQNAHYPISATDKAEADLIVKYDSSLFLVEVKGGALRAISKRGISGPLDDQLKRLIRDPHEQANRAREYVASSEEATFTGLSGEKVAVRRDAIKRTFLVTVLAEPIGHIFGRMTAESAHFSQVADLPWVVSILDLMVIADCLDGFGPWLPLYIQRRLRVLGVGKVRSGDELDLFMYFLKRGLYFEDDPELEDVDMYLIGTMTDELDWYYFRQMGLRKKKAARPRPTYDSSTFMWFQMLQSAGVPNWTDAVLAVIQMNEETRSRFTQNVAKAKARSRRDSQEHNIALSYDAGRGGITYHCDPTDLQYARMLRYVEWKRRETGANEWVLVGDQGRRRPHIAFVIADPTSCFAT